MKNRNLHSEFSVLNATLDICGFTTLELIVVIGITALLSGMLVVYGNTARQQTTFSIEQAKLTQLIYRARSLAVGTFVKADDPNPPCGYGISIERLVSPMGYSLFRYDKDSATGFCQPFYDVNGRIIVSRITNLSNENHLLPPGVVFRGGANELDYILFVPPDPKAFLFSGGVWMPSGAGRIYMTTQDLHLDRYIEVSQNGQISFQ